MRIHPKIHQVALTPPIYPARIPGLIILGWTLGHLTNGLFLVYMR